MISLVSISPKNLLEWSNMEDWVSGTSAAPTEHTLSGASATVAQEATIVKRGTYSAKVTRVGADAMLYYDLPSYASYQGRQMTFGCWVYATVASRVRLGLGDGVGTTNSSYHTGDSTWQFLTVTRNIDISATRLRFGMEVNTGNTSGYFDGGIGIEGATTFTDLSSYLEEWSPNKKYRMSKFVVARRPGVIIPNSEHGEKSIGVRGKVFGTTPTTARTAFDAMLQSLSGGEKDLYLYDDRFYRVFLSSQDHKYIAALRCVEFNLQFAMQMPFAKYIQRLRSQQTISSSPTTFTVTTSGSVFTKPIIKAVAGGSDITAFTLENLTTGQIMSFTATVTAGNTLEIDCDAMTVLNNSVDSIASFTGDFLRLEPGGNQIKITGSNCTLKLDWFDQYL